MDLCAGMFSKATLVKYLHICWPLAVDITHNRERKAPNALIHWTAALLLLQRRGEEKKKEEKSRCSLSPQQVLHYPSSSFVFFCVCFFCRSPDSADCSLSCCATPNSSVLMRKVNVSVAVPQLRPCLFCKCLSVSPFTSPTIEALFFS